MAEQSAQVEDLNRDGGQREPTVVGIGASAGGLKALKAFFEKVPEESDLAFVVVMHLSPDHESHLAEILQPHVRMPVQQVMETTLLEGNRVYVIPPNANLSAVDTHLRLTELEEKRRNRAPIDHFFRTLAETHDGHSIGVILTGTGSDGTLGIKSIKEKGGLTVVQSPEEAEYDGMPLSAVATGLVDLVLPLEQMPAEIHRFAQTEPRIGIPSDGEVLTDEEERRLLQKIFAQVRARTKRDFSRYKRSTILRRIRRRMQLRHIEEMEAYLEMLRDDVEEVKKLADDFLITVTNFFRDPEVFQRMEEEIMPRIFAEKDEGDDVRVWSVGCATGEEAYSLAMLLRETSDRYPEVTKIQVFASDLHERSLDKGRQGFYSGEIEAEVDPRRLRRFFDKENGGYRIKKELRDLVVFAPHNLLGDPPFSKIDLISCRNVLIYLQREVQKDVIELFHYALRPDGHLVLGTSETVEGADLFRVESKKHCFYRKRNVPAREPHLPVFPPVASRMGAMRYGDEQRDDEPAHHGMLHQKMVEQYAPPSMLVSPDHKVVHLSEHGGRYLAPSGGEFTSSVFKLVREELRIELRAALHLAREEGRATRSNPVTVQFDGASREVVLNVRPATEPEEDGYVLVIFDESERTAREGLRGTPSSQTDATVQELESELEMTKQRLQAVIEEYETSQEEMKASNEELQSSNEELRSTMEELETSKEELQSMNEELQTVNQENRHKVEEFAQLSDDLQNLLAATDIATLFLDKDLRILRFTPQVSEIFNVRMIDRGRPIGDLTHRLGYDELQSDATSVLQDLVPVEREVQDEAARHYLTRLLPYRSKEDRIEGVVITFVDITSRKEAEEELRESEERFRALVQASASTVWTTDAEGQVIEDSPSWRAFTGQSYDEWKDTGWTEAIHPDDRAAAVSRWREAVASGEMLKDEYRVYHAPSSSHRWMVVRAVPLRAPDESVRGWVGMNIDITEQKEAEQELRELNETLEERVEERTRQVRGLASSLTMAEQQERHRISQVLHDEVQQLLYGIQLKLHMAKQAADAGNYEKLKAHHSEVDSWIDKSIELTRRLTVDLSPPVLKSDGLVETLYWLKDQMEELHDLKVDIEVRQTIPKPAEDLRVLLFQVVRELLFNVAKHSGADRASVNLASADRTITITVSDAGNGFDLEIEETCHESTFGLFSVRERLHLIGGKVEIHSVPGEGTTVIVEVPLSTE